MLRLPIENTSDKKGEIMAEWKNYTLEEVCERIYSGGTPSTKHEEYWNGDIKWLSSGETSQRFVYDTERKITQEGVENSSTKLATKGCTVVATAGQGYTRGQASFLMTDTYMNQSVIACKANENVILPLYLYYNLDSRYEEFRLLSDGTSTRGGLSGWILKRMEIKLPPKSSQKKIIDILYSIDRKIEENKAINNNLEQQAKALYKDWFFDFFPFSTEGNLPNGWHLGTVGDIIQLHDSKRVPLSGSERDKMEKIYPYYGATSLMDYVDNYLFDGIYLLLGEDGTVVDSLGFPILQYVYGQFWVNNHAHIITGKEGFSVEELYLFFSLTNIKSIVTGAVQQKVSQQNLKKVPAIIPSKEALSAFDDLIQPVFAQIRNLRDENAHLADLRDTLLPRLMSGELDVSNIEL